MGSSLQPGEDGAPSTGSDLPVPEVGRTPGRVVHVKGAAALGYLEITHDITRWCRAAVFSAVGGRTPVLCRLSVASGHRDLADTMRDVRGFAVRHYTAGVLWDLVGHDTPVFFIRYPALFPSFIHTQQRDPVTHQKDPDMFWDFITLQPETMHQVSLLFSDRGTPDGYRHMNGYGSHAFKLVNAAGEHVWAKFHFKTDQGIRNLTAARAAELAASDPNYCIRDLQDAIAAGRPPSWTLHVQVMTPAEAAGCPFDPFDLTRVWPHGEFPLHPVGRLVLERNPTDEVAQVDHAAFAPANMPDGIEPSPDPMLLARMYSYSDTQQHRLGPNYSELPANCSNGNHSNPEGSPGTRQDAGDGYGDSGGGASDEQVDRPTSAEEPQEDFSQICTFWERVLGEDERRRLADNMAVHARDTQVFIQARIVKNWSMVCEDFGSHILSSLLRRNTPTKAEELRSALDSAEDEDASGADPPC